MDREAWRAVVQGVTKSWTRWSNSNELNNRVSNYTREKSNRTVKREIDEFTIIPEDFNIH